MRVYNKLCIYTGWLTAFLIGTVLETLSTEEAKIRMLIQPEITIVIVSLGFLFNLSFPVT